MTRVIESEAEFFQINRSTVIKGTPYCTVCLGAEVGKVREKVPVFSLTFHLEVVSGKSPFRQLCAQRCASPVSTRADWDTAASAGCPSARQSATLACHTARARGLVLSLREGGPGGHSQLSIKEHRDVDTEEDKWIRERRRVAPWQGETDADGGMQHFN